MVTPVPLHAVAPTVDSNVVETLDEIMTLTADGCIRAIAAVIVHADGSVDTCWSSNGDLRLFLAGSARLSYQLNQALDEAE